MPVWYNQKKCVLERLWKYMGEDLGKLTSDELLELYKQIRTFLDFLEKENQENEVGEPNE